MKSDLGNYKGALIDLNKALEIDPNLAYGYRYRAKNYDRQGNMTDACKDMKKASSLGDEVATRNLEMNPGVCK
ncbi:tetratricopeptide repeat family protein [Synechococcus sp. BIOS-U3-1]|nr:tetratricopeptide repeat family protein [Synechococcus sp. BIOS-U3-1]